jgi:predicted AAA+ superfamily ATPase
VIERHRHVSALEHLLRQFPVVAILGARQVGKTTLARQVAKRRRGEVTVFDLESAEDLSLLADPLLALRPLRGLVIIDEVQRRPELFSSLRVLADEPRVRRRFLVLGSASPELLRQASETLAGRIAYRFSPGPTHKAWPGGWRSSARTSNGTFRRSASVCRRRHCGGSG